jgi:prolyl-tRNA synthetase
MGSYGIGPARIVAAAIEQQADAKGIVWPKALAPWDVHLVSLDKPGTDVAAAADGVYRQLAEAGVPTLYDDREAGVGEKLTDAELIGVPLRLVVGRKGVAAGITEAQLRVDGAESEVPLDDVVAGVRELLDGTAEGI